MNIEGLRRLGARCEPPPSVLTTKDWIQLADDRLAWMLWGKAMPEGESGPAHPLLCHCLDVASVASLFLVERLPLALRNRFTSLHEDRSEALRFLLFLIALHDLGKATPAFQLKVDWAEQELKAKGFRFLGSPKEHHSNTGFFLLYQALEHLGLDREKACIYAQCVTAHHGEFPVNRFIRMGIGQNEKGRAPHWDSARRELIHILLSLFGPIDFAGIRTPSRADILALGGLTSVADWIGSLQDVFSYAPPWPTAQGYWLVALARAEQVLDQAGFRVPTTHTPRSFEALFAPFSPWPLHTQANMIAANLDTPSLIVVEAPMGEGKTEAALVIADAAAGRLGQDGLFIGLPTRATANQMFERTRRFLEATHEGLATLLLAHGEASLVDSFGELRTSAIYSPEEQGHIRAEAWFASKNRTLLGQHAVGTIDQALMAVMRVKHCFVRYFGLAGKTVVLDEVHAYDTYTGTLLDRLIEWLGAAGTTVVLLSATLPSIRRKALVEAYRRGAQTYSSSKENEETNSSPPYPRITVATADHARAITVGQRRAPVQIQVERLYSKDKDIDLVVRRLLEEVREGGCIAMICNTVARAQQIYRQLNEGLGADDVPRLLIHSRLFPAERLRRERLLESWLGPPSDARQRPKCCIVVGTQVLEQSLDVDFDLMVTDVAPIDLIFQRAGRLHRHDRPRPNNRKKPTLGIVMPEDDPVNANLKPLAAVYQPHFIRQTLLALNDCKQLVLPTDIEPLIERVYDPTLLPSDHPLSSGQIDQVGTGCAQRLDAETRLLHRVDFSGDFFGALKAPYDDDDDPRRHSSTLAKTRDGQPSMTLICLEQDKDGGLYGGTLEARMRVDLSKEPTKKIVRMLVERSINVSRPDVVHTLAEDDTAMPETWRKSAILRHRRLVIFEDGKAEVGNTCLELDSDLGLVLSPR